MSAPPHLMITGVLLNPKLHILVGIPGCGKSTFAKQLDGHVVSSDEIREIITGDVTDQSQNDLVFKVFHNTLKWGLTESTPVNVIADSTALDSRARATLREIAEEAGAETHLYLFKNTWEAVQRNRQRERVVPDHVMDRMLIKYEETRLNLPKEHYTSVTTIEGYR